MNPSCGQNEYELSFMSIMAVVVEILQCGPSGRLTDQQSYFKSYAASTGKKKKHMVDYYLERWKFFFHTLSVRVRCPKNH